MRNWLSPRSRTRLLVLALGVAAVVILVAVPSGPRSGASGVEWKILAVLVGVAVVSTVWATVLGTQTADELLLNLGSEMAGAVLTYVLLQMVVGGAATKAELIDLMGSQVRETALGAVEELKYHGWDQDGSLEGADLVYANLEGVHLRDANLRDVVLFGANLEGADLSGARLEEATLAGAKLNEALLWNANLRGANVTDAGLEGAWLTDANLQEADLTYVNLARARLRDADLSGARLYGADLFLADVSAAQLDQAASLEGAILPDGTRLSVDNWRAEFEAWREERAE